MIEFLKTPEFLFVAYLYGFATLRPILYLFKDGSSSILFFYTLIFLVAFFYSAFKKSVYLKNIFIWIVISLFFGVQFAFTLFYKDFTITSHYSISFLFNGVIPLLLLIDVKDFDRILRYVVVFSCINGAALIFDPFYNYAFCSGYMNYGFNILFYSFSGLLYAFIYYNKKIFLLFVLIEFAFISFFANKGAILGALAMLIFVLSAKMKNNAKFFALFLSVVIIFNWKRLIEFLLVIAEKFNLSTYSIHTLSMLLTNDDSRVYSARTNIWNYAASWISEKPIWGWGIGTFDESFGGYVHNIFLEITLMYGFIGLILFLVLLIHSVFKLNNQNDRSLKLFQSITLIAWLVTMQFSLTIWSVAPFWIYWGLYLYNAQNNFLVGQYKEGL